MTQSGPLEFKLRNILLQLKDVTDVFHLGVYLGVKADEVRRIEKDYKCDGLNRQKSEVISFWMENSDESDLSWDTLAEAVKNIGSHDKLATRISKLSGQESSPKDATISSSDVNVSSGRFKLSYQHDT